VNTVRSVTRRRTRRVSLAATAGLLGLVTLAGCSASPSVAPASAPPPPPVTTAAAPTSTGYSPQLCGAAAEFQTAANAILQLDATKVGTEGVKAALQNLAVAGQNLSTAAAAQFGPQVDALKQALASLQTTISGIQDQTSLSAKLGVLAGSVAQVQAAAKPILDSVRSGCPAVPSASTAPSS